MERLKRRQFTAEFKLEAARYVLDQGMSFAEVGKRLGVLPKLVRDWVVKYEKGELVAGAPKLRVTPEQMELSQLRQEVQRLRMERDILKNRPRGLPRPICVETSGAYTEVAPGQWPLAFWRRMSPSKNLAQGKLRTQLWWHYA
jgi:transposase